ncbi:MAG: putative porin [Methylococcaceae bacterium]|nr:putative porin [Methylococcaceae bacterium]
MERHTWMIALTLLGAVSAADADEKEELILLKTTTINLIEQLVKQGVITEKVANDMLKKADAEAKAEHEASKTNTVKDIKPELNEVRVPYVPEFVKDEIRQQVRRELKDEVVTDVMQKAKSEKWGTPDALPDWVNRFKLSGDMRLRYQNDFMASDNAPTDGQGNPYLNFPAINSAGGLNNTLPENLFLNTKEDRQRFRARVRLGIDAKVTDNLLAGVRLASGNLPDPVSTNQMMGNTGSQYEFNLDRAFLKYDAVDDENFKWLTLTGGRIANPWYVGGGEFTGGSELVWDTDLSFEGFAATGRYSLGSATGQPDKHDKTREVYATVGAFPLQEAELSSKDKWLFGGQVGLDWGFQNQDSIRAGLGYYDYMNIQGVPNTNNPPTCDTNQAVNNLSIPQFMQFGNTLVGICNDPTNSGPTLFGLASDYNIINFNIAYDLAKFAPYHLIVAADYAKNIGFDKTEINRLNVVNDKSGGEVEEETDAWQVRMDFGWPKVERYGQWNVFALYKYVGRDAVLDAFSDSDFHLGGTNAKGWVVGGNYGLMKNLWFTGRWLSTDVINGPKFGIDTLQLDVNAKF